MHIATPIYETLFLSWFITISSDLTGKINEGLEMDEVPVDAFGVSEVSVVVKIPEKNIEGDIPRENGELIKEDNQDLNTA